MNRPPGRVACMTYMRPEHSLMADLTQAAYLRPGQVEDGVAVGLPGSYWLGPRAVPVQAAGQLPLSVQDDQQAILVGCCQKAAVAEHLRRGDCRPGAGLCLLLACMLEAGEGGLGQVLALSKGSKWGVACRKGTGAGLRLSSG